MSHFDYATTSESVHKPGREQSFQSPAHYRLYWSTFYRMVNHKTALHRDKSQIWLQLGQFFDEIWNWWSRGKQSSIQVNDDNSQAKALISEEG